MPLALATELRPPRTRLGLWTLTLFPSTHAASSKSKLQDVTMEIGANLPRAWLRQVATLLASRPRRQTLLFGEASAKWSQLFNLSRQAAGLSKASPHQLRHGGASMDAVDQHTDPVRAASLYLLAALPESRKRLIAISRIKHRDCIR